MRKAGERVCGERSAYVDVETKFRCAYHSFKKVYVQCIHLVEVVHLVVVHLERGAHICSRREDLESKLHVVHIYAHTGLCVWLIW